MIEYDDYVRNSTREQRSMVMFNKHKSQLLAFRLLFNHLEAYQLSLKEDALAEFQNYSYFEKNANQKLKTLALNIHRLAMKKVQKSLVTWYDNSLKPLATIQNNLEIARLTYNRRLQAKVYQGWC